MTKVYFNILSLTKRKVDVVWVSHPYMQVKKKKTEFLFVPPTPLVTLKAVSKGNLGSHNGQETEAMKLIDVSNAFKQLPLKHTLSILKCKQ